jgi:cytochrome c oxidase assembly protein subunit 15
MNKSLNYHALYKLRTFAWWLLAYALIIIVWGAFVRISGSGDGCGKHWPLCHGTIIMSNEVTAQLQTWIEFAHRAKSGLFGVLIIFLVIGAHRVTGGSRELKNWSIAVLVLTLIEGFLGAQLVLQGWVGTDQSLGRAVMGSAHFVNTLLLLGAMVMTVLHAQKHRCIPLWRDHAIKGHAYEALGALLILGATGAWAALGSTLVPSESLTGGILVDFAQQAPFATRVRILHPILAVLLAALIIRYALVLWRVRRDLPARIFLFVSILQPCIGAVTLLSLSPTTLKLLHLFGADIVWIAGFYASFLCSRTTESNQVDKPA